MIRWFGLVGGLDFWDQLQGSAVLEAESKTISPNYMNECINFRTSIARPTLREPAFSRVPVALLQRKACGYTAAERDV